MRVMNLDLGPEGTGGLSVSGGEDQERLAFTFEVAALVKPAKKN